MLETLKTFIKNLFRKKQQDEVIKQLNVYEKALALLDDIEPQKFDKFNCSRNSGYSIISIYPNISTHVTKLKEVNHYLSTNKIIYANWCSEELTIVPIAFFFLTNDGYYLDEVELMERLKTLATVYFSLSNEKHNNVGVEEYNTRILTRYTEYLIKTIEDIISIQPE